jgi:hypothetical protein
MSKVHDSAIPRNQIYPITTFKVRDEWIKLLLAADGDELSPGAKIVGARIALHRNIETGQCNPSLPQLAAGTGTSDRNVRRMLNELEQAGWLIVDKSRGGRRSVTTYNSNSFELAVPITRTDVSGFNPDTIVRVKEPNPDKSGRLTRTNEAANPDTVVRQEKSESNSEEKSERIESIQLDLGEEDSGRRNQSPASETDADFEKFYRQYPKHVAKAAALKAYRAVISKRLATPAQLLNGALRYAAERSNQDPKYTKHASTWLTGGCWDDEPAQPIGATYNSSPPGQSHHIAVAEQIARQLMERDGGHAQ